jgi:hypothetical protein
MILDVDRSPDHMWQLRGQTLNKFGYDNTGSNVYKFNSQGYRSNIDFDFARPCLVTVGPSTSFGIGLPVEKTFPFLLAQDLALDNYNFSVGCLKHTSNDYLGLLSQLAKKPNIKVIVINWNNLSRVRNTQEVVDDHDRLACISRLENLIVSADRLISVPCFYTLFDPDQFDLPPELENKLLIYNKGVIDSSDCCGNFAAFGVNTHSFIYRVLLSKSREFYHSS